MRQIKFRAWDRNIKKWTVPFTLVDLATGEFIFSKDLEEDMETVQFTGLLDKNGNEIYEGDIVEASEMKFIIEHGWDTDEYYFGFVLKSMNGTKKKYALGTMDKYKIIGNIYENPELLK